MSRILLVLTAAAALVATAATRAETVTVTPDGTWYTFDVDELAFDSLEWSSYDDFSPLEFTFSTTDDVVLTVVDAGAYAGDVFSVYDNGSLLGQTSTVPNADLGIGLNFDAALASGDYSFATFLLAAGAHVITGELFASFSDQGGPLNATVGALSAQVVPLPASLLLLLGGSGLLGLFARRRA